MVVRLGFLGGWYHQAMSKKLINDCMSNFFLLKTSTDINSNWSLRLNRWKNWFSEVYLGVSGGGWYLQIMSKDLSAKYLRIAKN